MDKCDWFKVKEKLPPYYENVLIFREGLEMTVAYLMESNLWAINDWDEYESDMRLTDVTFWRKLPNNPTEKDNPKGEDGME